MAENMTMASNSDFKSWVSQLKQDIRSAQIRDPAAFVLDSLLCV